MRGFVCIRQFPLKARDVADEPNKILELINKVLDKLQGIPVVGTIIEDIRLMVSMLQDYASGKYKDVQKSTIVIIVITLLYFLNPIDIIPDFIPVIGYIDDLAVIGFALSKIHSEIQAFKLWKNCEENY